MSPKDSVLHGRPKKWWRDSLSAAFDALCALAAVEQSPDGLLAESAGYVLAALEAFAAVHRWHSAKHEENDPAVTDQSEPPQGVRHRIGFSRETPPPEGGAFDYCRRHGMLLYSLRGLAMPVFVLRPPPEQEIEPLIYKLAETDAPLTRREREYLADVLDETNMPVEPHRAATPTTGYQQQVIALFVLTLRHHGYGKNAITDAMSFFAKGERTIKGAVSYARGLPGGLDRMTEYIRTREDAPVIAQAPRRRCK